MSFDLCIKLKVGQVVWLVQWCSSAAFNEDGSLDLDGCELHQQIRPDLQSAHKLAAEVLPQNVFDCVRIVEAVASDPFELGRVSLITVGDREYFIQKETNENKDKED